MLGMRKIFREEKSQGTTAATKEDVQRDLDMDHLHTLLDQCTDEDILQ